MIVWWGFSLAHSNRNPLRRTSIMNSPDSLSQELRFWRVRPPLEPNFRASVWQRIECDRRAHSWPTYLRAHAIALGLLLVVAIGGSGWMGRSLAQAQVDSDRARLAAVYVANLDARVQAGLWD